MDDELPLPPDAPAAEDGEDGENRGEAAAAPAPLPSLPPEVTDGDDEVRRLVEAGASTPEELRELAARIRAQREREDELWREEVRPALKEAKKRPFQLGDLVERDDDGGPNVYLYGLGMVAAAAFLVLAATQSSILWVLLPLVGVLVYAFVQGRKGGAVDEPPPPAEDATD
jgi:hypothetical protein